MALVLGFATPEPVLVIAAGEVDTFDPDRTARTDLLGGGFSALSSLRSLGGGREEELREPLARPVTHPIVIGCDAVEFECRHVHTPVCLIPCTEPVDPERSAD
jgi:hypothetical protein